MMLKQGPFRTQKNIILASSSPRRQKLLASLGLNFEVIPSKIKEPPPSQDISPGNYAKEMSELKAQDVCTKKKKGIIVSADTVVVFKNEILGKPSNAENAINTLIELCGNKHYVISGCCLLDTQSTNKFLFTVTTEVTMAQQDKDVLKAYVATDEPLDKVGSYAIQGIGNFLVQNIRGSYSNVIGLPLCEVVQGLLDLEAIHIVSSEEIKR